MPESPTQIIGKSFLKSYAAVCLEGVIIVLACIIFSVIAKANPGFDDELSAAAMVWSYIGAIASSKAADLMVLSELSEHARSRQPAVCGGAL